MGSTRLRKPYRKQGGTTLTNGRKDGFKGGKIAMEGYRGVKGTCGEFCSPRSADSKRKEKGFKKQGRRSG